MAAVTCSTSSTSKGVSTTFGGWEEPEVKCMRVHLKEFDKVLFQMNRKRKRKKSFQHTAGVVEIKAAKLPQWEDVQNFHFQDDWTTGSKARRPTEGS